MKRISKILIVVIITLSILIGLKVSKKFNKFFYKNIYETSIPFMKINNWYEKNFGTLPFKDKDTPVFKEKLVYSSYEKYLDGVN